MCGSSTGSLSFCTCTYRQYIPIPQVGHIWCLSMPQLIRHSTIHCISGTSIQTCTSAVNVSFSDFHLFLLLYFFLINVYPTYYQLVATS